MLHFIDLVLFKTRSFTQYLDYIGLIPAKSEKGTIIGFVHGFFFVVIMLAAFLVLGRNFVSSSIVNNALAGWGVYESNIILMILFMIIFNGFVGRYSGEDIFIENYQSGRTDGL